MAFKLERVLIYKILNLYHCLIPISKAVCGNNYYSLYIEWFFYIKRTPILY